jgi:hypothetical protein
MNESANNETDATPRPVHNASQHTSPTVTEYALGIIALTYLGAGLVVLLVVGFLRAAESREHVPQDEEVMMFILALAGHLVAATFLFAIYHVVRYLRLITAHTARSE